MKHLRRLRVMSIMITTFVTSGLATSHADDMGVDRPPPKDQSFFASFAHADVGLWTLENASTDGEDQSCEWRADAIGVANNKLQLRISDQGGQIHKIGCAEMHTNAALHFGLYEVSLRAAAGPGLDTDFRSSAGVAPG
ncbi:MAG: hypothetical protein M3N08_08165, partial [Pseudomonadota bacterium]|nr:hypothetical protein [Pseudomonadota bacterium]